MNEPLAKLLAILSGRRVEALVGLGMLYFWLIGNFLANSKACAGRWRGI
jgi:hypothetical protein